MQLICCGFYVRATLALNGLRVMNNEFFSTKLLQSFREKDNIFFWRGVESKTIFKTQVFFKKILFTETNESYIGHLHSLFFVFAAPMKLSLIDFLDCTRNTNVSPWCILKTTNLKIGCAICTRYRTGWLMKLVSAI